MLRTRNHGLIAEAIALVMAVALAPVPSAAAAGEPFHADLEVFPNWVRPGESFNFSVIVSDRDTNPVSGAVVQAWLDNETLPLGSNATTGPDGEFFRSLIAPMSLRPHVVRVQVNHA